MLGSSVAGPRSSGHYAAGPPEPAVSALEPTHPCCLLAHYSLFCALSWIRVSHISVQYHLHSRFILPPRTSQLPTSPPVCPALHCVVLCP